MAIGSRPSRGAEEMLVMELEVDMVDVVLKVLIPYKVVRCKQRKNRIWSNPTHYRAVGDILFILSRTNSADSANKKIR